MRTLGRRQAEDPWLDSEFPGAGPLRPEIAQSWRRAHLAGLPPDAPADRFTIQDFDPRSRLLAAADPVLDKLADELADTGFCVFLGDQESRIVGLRFGSRRLRTVMEAAGAVFGRSFTEDVTGTNSIATTYELRSGIAVHGEEHYLEAFKPFSCYGHPLIHPVTRRLVGVLDITCLAKDDSPLLTPFLIRAAQDIERRLLEGAREVERRMLATFQTASLHKAHPVLMLGDEVVLANPAAIEILDGSDHALLRGLALDAGPGGSPATLDVELSSGRRMTVRAAREPNGGGVLFELFPGEAGPQLVPRARGPHGGLRRILDRYRDQRLPVLISGEPGSGRSTTLRRLAGDLPLAVLDATDLDDLGEQAWLAQLEHHLAADEDRPSPDQDGPAADHDGHDGSTSGCGGLVAIEGVHLLPEPIAAKVARLLRGSARWHALTSSPVADLRGEQAALVSHCIDRVELPPLRARREELPDLARAMLSGHPGLRLTPAALEVLAGHSWPGNLRELEAVLRDVAERRPAGDITVRDLPPAYQNSRKSRRLSPLEHAEHDAIVAALRASGGNKVHAAKRLGISRTTLYSRIRALGVVT